MATEREPLGHGGYGSVYKTRYPPGSDTFVAVKEIVSDMFGTEDQLKEIRALRKLTKHKNIVRIIDYGVQGTLMKIYMELCNKPLLDYIFKKQNQVLLPALPSKGKMFRQLSDALDFCHSQGIVHKDIKPLNILVKDENNSTVLKICDFGFSKLLSSRTGNQFPAYDPSSLPATSPDFEATGGGTYGYRCAELLQAESWKRTVATAKVDVFALGIVFFQIICGPVHPFGGLNEAEKNIVLGQHYLERYLPKGCEAFHLIDRMLSLSPSERPTMAAVCRYPLLMTTKERMNFIRSQVDKAFFENRYEEYFHIPEKFAWERLPGIVYWKDIPAYRIMQLKEYDDWLTAFFDDDFIYRLKESRLHPLGRDKYNTFESKRADHDYGWRGGAISSLLEPGKYEKPSLLLFVWLEAYATFGRPDMLNFYLFRTAAQKIIEVDDIKEIEKLLENATDLNTASDIDGKTLLHFALNKASKTTVEFLHGKGANSWNVTDISGWTPLHYAARRPSEFLKLYFEKFGLELHDIHNQGRTPLHIAASLGLEENVEILLRHGANVNAVDKDGNTPIFHAAVKQEETEAQPEENVDTSRHSDGHDEEDDFTVTARLLIQYGADIRVRNKANESPLFVCAKNDAVGIAKLLVDHETQKTDVDARGGPPNKWTLLSDIRETALFYAARGNSANVAKLLLERGASVNVEDADNETPLIIASREDSVEVAKVLLENGADARHGRRFGFSPLLLAKSVEMAELLLAHGASVHEKFMELDGETPIFLATMSNDVRLVDFYLSREALIDERDKSGDTPLFYAVRANAVDTVKLLIARGASVNVKNEYGETPLDLAFGLQNVDASVIEALLNAGSETSDTL